MSGNPNPSRSSTVYNVEVRGRAMLEVIPHAEDRMRERGVSLDEVLETLDAPDQEGLPADPPRQRVRKLIGASGALDVIFEEQADRIVLVSVVRIGRRLSGRF